MEDELMAYIVSSSRVDCVTVPLNAGEGSQVEQNIVLLAQELETDRGKDAVSTRIQSLASEIAKLAGSRRIVSCMPHSFLHQVPWRVLLRAHGLSWSQLSFPTEFGFVVRQLTERPAPFPVQCAALGFDADKKDLSSGDSFAEEAKSFANAFKENGRFLDPCNRSTLELALSLPGLAFVSCHASARNHTGAAAVWLKLSDGGVSLEEVLPARLSKTGIIMSACESGVFKVTYGDYPIGAIPEILRRGAAFVVGTRCKVRNVFAAFFFPRFGEELAKGSPSSEAFATALAAAETAGYELWRDLASVEMYMSAVLAGKESSGGC